MSGENTLPIAAVAKGDDDGVYAALTEVAHRLRGEGWALAGAVRGDAGVAYDSACQMTLELLPDGQVIGISQDLGPNAEGCRLNHEALEDVVGLVDEALAHAPRLLILNKFGAQECEGAGFRQTIARAVSDGVPVLVGVNEPHREAFESFAGGEVHVLPPRVDAILEWCREVAA